MSNFGPDAVERLKVLLARKACLFEMKVHDGENHSRVVAKGRAMRANEVGDRCGV